MKRIKIEPFAVNLVSKRLMDASDRLNNMSCEVKNQINSMDWDLMYKSRVVEHVDQISAMAKTLSVDSERIASFLKNVVNSLQNADSASGNNLGKSMIGSQPPLWMIPKPPQIPYLPICKAIPAVGLPWIGGLISRIDVVGNPIAEAARKLEEIYSTPPCNPVEGEYIWNTNNGFKRRSEPTDLPYGHRAIDIQPKIKGENPVLKAAFGGRVVEIVSSKEGYGNRIVIETRINGKYYRMLYAHLVDDSIKVKEGDIIGAGTKIGNMGTTGASTGVHLHFEMREVNDNGSFTRVDPVPILAEKGIKL